MSELDGNMREREKARRLVHVDKEMHVSYETLRLTVEFFGDLNQTVVKRISEEDASSSRLSNMMFGNAVMIYEVKGFSNPNAAAEDMRMMGYRYTNNKHLAEAEKVANAGFNKKLALSIITAARGAFSWSGISAYAYTETMMEKVIWKLPGDA